MIHTTEVLAYVIGVGAPKPDGCIPTKIPGHFVMVHGYSPESPHVIHKDLLDQVPQIMELMPVEFRRGEDMTENLAVFYPVVPEMADPATIIPANAAQVDSLLNKVKEATK
jgi:hypothetical protein